MTMQASRYHGPSRIRYRFLDLTHVPSFYNKKYRTSLARYLPIPQEEDKNVKLSYHEACVALPIIRNRRRIQLVFLDPERIGYSEWSHRSSDRLSPEELACLTGRTKLYDKATIAVASAVCEFRGLMFHGVRTEVGTRLLTLYENLNGDRLKAR